MVELVSNCIRCAIILAERQTPDVALERSERKAEYVTWSAFGLPYGTAGLSRRRPALADRGPTLADVLATAGVISPCSRRDPHHLQDVVDGAVHGWQAPSQRNRPL